MSGPAVRSTIDSATSRGQNLSPMDRRHGAWVLAWLLLAGPVSAESPAALDDYSVTTWSEKDGLPAGSIRSLEQGADGDLWLGTETGLVRFDGVRFVPFSSQQPGRIPP